MVWEPCWITLLLCIQVSLPVHCRAQTMGRIVGFFSTLYVAYLLTCYFLLWWFFFFLIICTRCSLSLSLVLVYLYFCIFHFLFFWKDVVVPGCLSVFYLLEIGYFIRFTCLFIKTPFFRYIWLLLKRTKWRKTERQVRDEDRDREIEKEIRCGDLQVVWNFKSLKRVVINCTLKHDGCSFTVWFFFVRCTCKHDDAARV